MNRKILVLYAAMLSAIAQHENSEYDQLGFSRTKNNKLFDVAQDRSSCFFLSALGIKLSNEALKNQIQTLIAQINIRDDCPKARLLCETLGQKYLERIDVIDPVDAYEFGSYLEKSDFSKMNDDVVVNSLAGFMNRGYHGDLVLSRLKDDFEEVSANPPSRRAEVIREFHRWFDATVAERPRSQSNAKVPRRGPIYRRFQTANRAYHGYRPDSEAGTASSAQSTTTSALYERPLDPAIFNFGIAENCGKIIKDFEALLKERNYPLSLRVLTMISDMEDRCDIRFLNSFLLEARETDHDLALAMIRLMPESEREQAEIFITTLHSTGASARTASSIGGGMVPSVDVSRRPERDAQQLSRDQVKKLIGEIIQDIHLLGGPKVQFVCDLLQDQLLDDEIIAKTPVADLFWSLGMMNIPAMGEQDIINSLRGLISGFDDEHWKLVEDAIQKFTHDPSQASALIEDYKHNSRISAGTRGSTFQHHSGVQVGDEARSAVVTSATGQRLETMKRNVDRLGVYVPSDDDESISAGGLVWSDDKGVTVKDVNGTKYVRIFGNFMISAHNFPLMPEISDLPNLEEIEGKLARKVSWFDHNDEGQVIALKAAAVRVFAVDWKDKLSALINSVPERVKDKEALFVTALREFKTDLLKAGVLIELDSSVLNKAISQFQQHA